MQWAILALAAAGVAAGVVSAWAELEGRRLVLQQIEAAHGEEVRLAPGQPQAWSALFSGQTVDARLLGIGGL